MDNSLTIAIINMLCTLITILVWRCIIKHETSVKDHVDDIRLETLWIERQTKLCKDNIHVEKDWEIVKSHAGNAPWIRCKHCYKTPKEGK